MAELAGKRTETIPGSRERGDRGGLGLLGAAGGFLGWLGYFGISPSGGGEGVFGGVFFL